MQGLPGLEEVSSDIGAGFGNVNLTFAVGTDMDAALVEVLARMNRLPPLPRDADRPVVQSGNNDANASLTFFFVQQLPGTRGDILDYQQFIEDRVIPRIEAVEGVAGGQMMGGAGEEVAITMHVDRAAALGIQIPEVAAQAARATDASAGALENGRREYLLRFAGRYDPQALGDLILAWRDGRPVRPGDLTTIDVRRPEQRFFAYQNGNPAIGLRIIRENGANVLEALENVKRVVEDVRAKELAPNGLDIRQSFDLLRFADGVRAARRPASLPHVDAVEGVP